MSNVAASKVKAYGESVTYRTSIGSIGTGRLLDGRVLVSLANGFFGPVEMVVAIRHDQGDAYMHGIRYGPESAEQLEGWEEFNSPNRSQDHV